MNDSEFLHNVKEHTPPPMESQETVTEELNGGCRDSSCCALQFDSWGSAELDKNGESQPYRVIKKNTLMEAETLRQQANFLEAALIEMPKNKSRAYYIHVHGKTA